MMPYSHLESSAGLKAFTYEIFISRACPIIVVTMFTCDDRRVPMLLCMMPKTRSLCPSAESNLEDRVLGGVQQQLLLGKGRCNSVREKLCPNLGGFGEEFYSSGSRVGLLIRIRVSAGFLFL